MEEEKKKYTASAQVEQARQEAQASDARKPGKYVSKWQQQLDAAMEKILNREKFSYNLNGDALYRQYKDQAIQNGRLAMQDTLGQAAAMTGGFGSSYGQTAAQQAYRQQMANLGDKASALYDKARSEYDRQGTADKQAYDLLLQRENSSQNQYKQNLAAWEAENQRLWSRYDQARSDDYGAYRDEIKDDQWLRIPAGPGAVLRKAAAAVWLLRRRHDFIQFDRSPDRSGGHPGRSPGHYAAQPGADGRAALPLRCKIGNRRCPRQTHPGRMDTAADPGRGISGPG